VQWDQIYHTEALSTTDLRVNHDRLKATPIARLAYPKSQYGNMLQDFHRTSIPLQLVVDVLARYWNMMRPRGETPFNVSTADPKTVADIIAEESWRIGGLIKMDRLNVDITPRFYIPLALVSLHYRALTTYDNSLTADVALRMWAHAVLVAIDDGHFKFYPPS
jgi:hypothetical protein